MGSLQLRMWSTSDRLNLFSDMALAGIVTCGFAAAYNTTWSHIAMAAVGGMAGHGLRYLALEAGWNLDAATFLGGLGVGLVSAWIARSTKTPVAVIAYAGAVTMMPGLPIYRALGGALQLARLQECGRPAGNLCDAWSCVARLPGGGRACAGTCDCCADSAVFLGTIANRQHNLQMDRAL